MLSVSSGGRAIAKKTLAPQTKITIVIRNGIDRPGDLEHQAAVDARADAVGRAAAVLHRVVDDQAGDQQREEDRDADEEEIQRVDAAGHRRRAFREERGAGPHVSVYVSVDAQDVRVRSLGCAVAAALSRRSMTKMNAPSASTVAAPARRIARMMTRP